MNNRSIRDRIAEEFVNSLNENEIPWQSMWRTKRPYNATTDKDYHGINAMWLSYQAEMQGYNDPRWCTFNQAKDKGWNVKKGEKGTQVEFWSVYDIQNRQTLSLEEADKIIKENPERKDDMRIMAKHYTVFNAQQINGIPQLEEESTKVDIAAIKAQRDILLQNMGLTFREGGNNAFYRLSDDSITMPPDKAFKDDYSYMSTLLHEAGHATGHSSRLNRDMSGTFGSESYAKEELRAEIASAFTSQALGFGAEQTVLNSSMDNHKAYIQSWAKAIKDAPNELFSAIKDAENISDYLIEKGEFKIPEKAKTVIEEKNKLSFEEKLKAAYEKSEIETKQQDVTFTR